MPPYLLELVQALAFGIAGAAVGAGVRWASVRLARLEELEPGRRRWQVYGPSLALAFMYVAFGLQHRPVAELAVRLVFGTVFAQIIFFDLEHRLILDRVVYPSAVLALLISFFGVPWWSGLAAGVGLGAAFLLLGIVGTALTKEDALGLGDVKLAVMIGLLLGPLPAFEAVGLGVLVAGLVAIAIAVWRRSLKGSIALGPFLAIGALVALYQLT